MFKNRVRTAALAGAIAIATGLSGFSAPAFAQTAQDGYNAGDASAAAPVVAENISEATLRDLTNETAAYLKTWMDSPSNKEIVEAYISLGEDGFGPSEQAAQAAFNQARQNATAELAKAAENIQKARASVAYAKQVDEKAEQDWDAFVEALNAYRELVNPLIDEVNEQNKSSLPEIESIPEARRGNAVKVFNKIVALQEIANKQWDKAGEWRADENSEDFITRYHMDALQALKDFVNERAAGLKTVRDTAIASNVEAQKSDVLVRQLFLERATAQRDTLRAVEAYFSVAARYIELYQDTTLVGEKKVNLRTLYRNVLAKVTEGIAYNVEHLNEIDARALAWYLDWETDLKRNHDQNLYDEWKLKFATITYEKIFANGYIWQEAVERVELIDQQAKAERQAEIERLERERKMAEDLAKIAEGKTNSGSSSFKLSS